MSIGYWHTNAENPGSRLTTAIWRCCKPFSQWQCSFQRKLHCHWLKFLQQRHVVIAQDPVCSKNHNITGLLWSCFWMSIGYRHTNAENPVCWLAHVMPHHFWSFHYKANPLTSIIFYPFDAENKVKLYLSWKAACVFGCNLQSSQDFEEINEGPHCQEERAPADGILRNTLKRLRCS